MFEKWKELGDSGKDSWHGEMRVACMEENTELIKELSKQMPVDAFGGLALRISVLHGKYQSIVTLLELGASVPEELIYFCKKYMFFWRSFK